MTISITRAIKPPIVLESPVMNASGTMGFADEYADLIKFEKLGAFVTNPVTLNRRDPANWPHIIPLDGGILVHTGHPNDGLYETVSTHQQQWDRMPVQILMHILATTPFEVKTCFEYLETIDAVEGIELGLRDDIEDDDLIEFVKLATRCEKPVLVQLPFNIAPNLVKRISDLGVDGLVLCAPPRVTARDSIGKLVAGRLYSPVIKPMMLRMVGQLAREIDVPIVACGGIHSTQDAYDFLEAGAKAVQIDSLVWTHPAKVEIIARDLGGWVLTQPSGAMPDEWYPGFGETARYGPNDPSESQKGQPKR